MSLKYQDKKIDAGNKPDFAVIFDMDGVIVDSNPVHKIALKKFLVMHGHNLTEQELKEKIYGRANKDWLPELFDNDLSPDEFKKMAEEKEALFRKLYAPAIKPVKGLLRFLYQLRELNIPIALATSAPPANVTFTLEKTNTADFFETIIDESQINHGKPDPEIYLKTARQLGIEPDRCIVIEDSMAGVQSAAVAGCKVIGMTTTHSKEDFVNTVLVIDDFDELDITSLEDLLSKTN